MIRTFALRFRSSVARAAALRNDRSLAGAIPPSPRFSAAAAFSARPFSTKEGDDGATCETGICKLGECLDKLGAIMQEYRKANYAQTVPSRFAKEIVRAADVDHDGMITVDEAHGLLRNIGAADRMTKEEIDRVLTEMGITGGVRAVPNEEVIRVMMERTRR